MRHVDRYDMIDTWCGKGWRTIAEEDDIGHFLDADCEECFKAIIALGDKAKARLLEMQQGKAP